MESLRWRHHSRKRARIPSVEFAIDSAKDLQRSGGLAQLGVGARLWRASLADAIRDFRQAAGALRGAAMMGVNRSRPPGAGPDGLVDLAAAYAVAVADVHEKRS
jgi:hypothetical protein